MPTAAAAQHGRITLKYTWVHYDGGYGKASYAVVQDGNLCVVSGLIRYGGTFYTHLADLPPPCRPKKRLIFGLSCSQQQCRVDVHTNGVIQHIGGAQSGWISPVQIMQSSGSA